MNTELLNKTINEINPKILVEWHNVTQANLDWFAVSKHQNLSEQLIRQYSYKVDWEAVKFLTMFAKLWISDENIQMCRWREDNKTLIPHTLKTAKEGVTVPGNIILNPRMLILLRSVLLKVRLKQDAF